MASPRVREPRPVRCVQLLRANIVAVPKQKFPFFVSLFLDFVDFKRRNASRTFCSFSSRARDTRRNDDAKIFLFNGKEPRVVAAVSIEIAVSPIAASFDSAVDCPRATSRTGIHAENYGNESARIFARIHSARSCEKIPESAISAHERWISGACKSLGDRTGISAGKFPASEWAKKEKLNYIFCQIHCETDFVARNPWFQLFGLRVATSALLLQSAALPVNLDPRSFMDQPLTPWLLKSSSSESASTGSQSKSSSGSRHQLTVQEGLIESVGLLGENIQIGRILVSPASSPLKSPRTTVASFIHGGLPLPSEVTAVENGVPLFPSQLEMGLGRLAGWVSLQWQPAFSESSAENVMKSEQLDAQLVPVAEALAEHVIGMSPRSTEEFMHQPFLRNTKLTVQEYITSIQQELKLDQLAVGEFHRFDCADAPVVDACVAEMRSSNTTDKTREQLGDEFEENRKRQQEVRAAALK